MAEIGVNWDGKIEFAEEMINKAKDSGCNGIKFQVFRKKLTQPFTEKKLILINAFSTNAFKNY